VRYQAVPDLPPVYAEVSGEGPAVMLLHGQPGTGSDWQWVAPRLENKFTVIIPDRPGYGRTGGTATGFAGNGRAAIELLDRLGWEQAILVGHSWAGGAALAAAHRYPKRVSGLVLVASVGPGERMRWDDRLLAAPVVGELIAAVAVGGVGLLVGSKRVQSLANRHPSGRARDALSALSRLTRGRSRVWQSFVTEQRAMIVELDGLAAALPSITVPTAILNGQSDHLVPPEVGETLQRAIPGASRRLLLGVGHLLPHDRPEAIAEAVREVAGYGTSRGSD
jgi:pimeloyl-ACP methyl ester carboxylesterase